VTLGPHLNAITPDTSGPDAQSLEAFARAQGLDEQAVHWLFGGATGHDPQLTKPDAVVPSDVIKGAGVEGLGMVEGQPLGVNPQTTTALNPTAPAQISPPNPTLPVKGDGSAPGTVVSALLGVQALWSSEEASVAPPKNNTLTSSDEALPIQMLRMPPPAAVWMQRTVLNSVLQDKVSTQKESTVSISELDLGTDWGGEILQELLVTEGGTTSTGTHGTAYANFASRWDAQATQRNDLTLANSPAQDLPDTQARSESIQNLADKMGQAVGQRILSEMEKGQWHLKLQLRPATLGHIEVEMRMRSGEFDAIFTAPNAITRDLLQDGLGKLRETLAQMGMDVANIHVDSGQTGQSGGDPTSGSPRGKTPQEGVSAPESVAETTRAPRVKDPKNGLDVLV
jgi:flagellar hook-length control protein FliK